VWLVHLEHHFDKRGLLRAWGAQSAKRLFSMLRHVYACQQLRRGGFGDYQRATVLRIEVGLLEPVDVKWMQQHTWMRMGELLFVYVS